jgi:hypothetical protein
MKLVTKANNTGDMTDNEQNTSTGQSNPINIQEFNDANASNQIHFDGNNTYYALSEYEFKILKNGVDNYWKELCVASWSIFIPLCINTIAEGKNLEWNSTSWELFFNSLFTILTFVLAIIFSIAWNKSKNPINDVIQNVEKKPKFKI